MNLLESLNNPDIEIAQVAVNLLLGQSVNIIQIEELLKKTRYRVATFDRNYITLRKTQGLYEQMQGNTYKMGKYDKDTLLEVFKLIYANTKGNP